jgi:hypothetical protein
MSLQNNEDVMKVRVFDGPTILLFRELVTLSALDVSGRQLYNTVGKQRSYYTIQLPDTSRYLQHGTKFERRIRCQMLNVESYESAFVLFTPSEHASRVCFCVCWDWS